MFGGARAGRWRGGSVKSSMVAAWWVRVRRGRSAVARIRRCVVVRSRRCRARVRRRRRAGHAAASRRRPRRRPAMAMRGRRSRFRRYVSPGAGAVQRAMAAAVRCWRGRDGWGLPGGEPSPKRPSSDRPVGLQPVGHCRPPLRGARRSARPDQRENGSADRRWATRLRFQVTRGGYRLLRLRVAVCASHLSNGTSLSSFWLRSATGDHCW
jgi:hypothetical protein